MKIALVDIDGCLVQDGKLNQRLIERLKGYDQIILFTQRGKHIQQRSLNRKICNDLMEADEASIKTLILTTYDAVTAIESELNKEVKVSTSMDHYYKGKVLDYYPQELAEFERKLKDFYITDAGRDGAELPDHLMRSIIKEHRMVAGSEDYELATIDTFYPKGKVEQFCQLSDYLRSNYNEFTLDYFDDHEDNIKEILSSNKILKKPRCLLVTGASTVSYNDIEKREKNSEQHAGFAKALQNYIDTRAAEQQETGKIYKSTGARFFNKGASAEVKIRAAEKMLDNLLNETDKSFTRIEYKALNEGRLGGIIAQHDIKFKSESKKPG